ncbi:MAG: nucleotide exchange factor GrpE [Actinomycetota bacterium]
MGSEEEEEGRVKIPIRDKRKIHDHGAAQQGGAVVGEAVEPEPDAVDPDVALAEAQAKAASHLEDLQRLKAEFDNYRKRTLKEQSRLIEMASAEMVAQLLGVVDHFGMAMTAAAGGKDYDAMLKGVEMVYGELKQVLEGAGLQIVDPKGEPFDPNVHQAVLQDEGDGSGHMIVDEVLRNGYLFKGTVLRPAMVKVTQDASGAVDAGA